jgi:hypothetical protein
VSDRLAQIEYHARGDHMGFIDPEDVLALVEIAKVARHYLNGTDPDGYVNLHRALSVLDDREEA